MGGCEYFPESTFALSRESRLPEWITLPAGLTRDDTSITMSYYMKLWGWGAQFALRDTGGKVLQKVNGKRKCDEPFHLHNSEQGVDSDYPAYEAIAVNGKTEIIEHKRAGPLFYVTDDPAIWKQYTTSGCH